MLVDALDFRVDGLFQNDVTLAIDRTSAQPGENVQFTLNAAPDSFVGVLAVDQSVLLLKSGNDITQDMASRSGQVIVLMSCARLQVEDDIQEYDTTRAYRPWRGGFGGVGRFRRSTWYSIIVFFCLFFVFNLFSGIRGLVWAERTRRRYSR